MAKSRGEVEADIKAGLGLVPHFSPRIHDFPFQIIDELGDAAEALRASEAEHGASVVLVAVVPEFESKAEKANRQANDNSSARDAVMELEQASDSAKAAAEVDLGLSELDRQAVLDAHPAICILKTEI